ncbi:hypothetical protein Tco_0590902 [Tanacetum coccineum]
MDSPPNHECEQALDIDDFDLRLTPVVHPSNNPHILPKTATTTQTVFLSQNHQVDNYVVNPIRIIPGPASIVKTAKLHKIADTREGVEESLMSTQEYIRKVIEDIMTGCFGDVKKFLKNGKLAKVVAIIKSFTPNALGDLTAMDSQIISLKEELQDMLKKYNELREENASKNHLSDDTPMCERHEANYIQSEGYQNQNSYDSYSRQSDYDPNDSEKSLTELNNDVRNDLKDFKRCVRSMRTVHWKLYDSDDRKTTGVLPNKKSKTVNQEPQSKTDFEKSITKFLDGQRVTNMTDPPPPQAHTEQVNAVFTGSGRSDDSSKTQKDPPPPIIVDNKIEEYKPIKTSKRDYQVVKTNEYLFREYIPKIPYPQRLNVDHSYLNRIVKMCTYGLCRLFWDIGIGIKLYEWADNLVAPEIVLDHHLLDLGEHSLLVLRSLKYPKSKKNMLDEEEVLCQP